MRVAIASDHAAIEMKAALVQWLVDAGHVVNDLGPMTTDSVDYPDYGYKLANAIASGDADRGVALCGSGVGISIAANRNPACRCALVSEGLSAKLAREHNDANVICLPAKFISLDLAVRITERFLAEQFEGGRHARRVDKISC